nr:14221_t:CDS:2 [Entrophospora candida]
MLDHEVTYKQESAQCNYCSHKLLTASNCCEQHLKKCTKVLHHILDEYFSTKSKYNYAVITI